MENAHADMRRIQAHALKNAFQNEPAEREEREKKKSVNGMVKTRAITTGKTKKWRGSGAFK